MAGMRTGLHLHILPPCIYLCSSSGLCLHLTVTPVIVTQLKLDPEAGLMFVAGYHRQLNQPSRAGGVFPYTMAAHPVSWLRNKTEK